MYLNYENVFVTNTPNFSFDVVKRKVVNQQDFNENTIPLSVIPRALPEEFSSINLNLPNESKVIDYILKEDNNNKNMVYIFYETIPSLVTTDDHGNNLWRWIVRYARYDLSTKIGFKKSQLC